MVACCSPARARMKRAATRKATAAANRAVKSGKGIKPKKATAKKASPKKATAKKAKPCRICGKH